LGGGGGEFFLLLLCVCVFSFVFTIEILTPVVNLFCILSSVVCFGFGFVLFLASGRMSRMNFSKVRYVHKAACRRRGVACSL
jgi:hypothetical protein